MDEGEINASKKAHEGINVGVGDTSINPNTMMIFIGNIMLTDSTISNLVSTMFDIFEGTSRVIFDISDNDILTIIFVFGMTIFVIFGIVYIGYI